MCLVVQEKVSSGDPYMTANTMGLLGSALAGQGEFSEAEPILLNAYARLRSIPGTDSSISRCSRVSTKAGA